MTTTIKYGFEWYQHIGGQVLVCDLGFSTDVQLQPVCSVFVLSHSHYAAVIHTSVVFACSRS